ncbi:esterase-like activity of phytase family protein [Adhaeretor mobilis]|uniref:Phytase-like domain-containing protein n=1 Tax=Adhaeretor mobilis TaxID=1930276 RepID=A0A517MRV2_9BACT|nr:esterase-like activity of phytase family protein [Adhaeretor mobilis]QDS97606.1 hypothetical protein HG15A2_08690 [Adhaeretor mobilis]
MLRFTLALLLAATLAVSSCSAARWSITHRDTLALDANGFTVAELSGVAYDATQSSPLIHVFNAVQDDGSGVVEFRLTMTPSDAVLWTTATASYAFSVGRDDEGIAISADPDVVLVSEEGTPSLRQIRLSDGAVLSVVAAPAVFSTARANRGFESAATWSVANSGFRLATVNEEALTIDGPTANTSNGTMVRVQTYDLTGNSSSALTATATKQFAYEVDPIHAGTSTNSSTRSGLSELVAMPDKTLLALERSAAIALPGFQNRLYEIDSSAATDTNATAFDAGLAGATYTPAAKQSLWTGTIGSGIGQNLEGLTVGPQLDNGNWLLVGVVDDGDQFSSNTIVTFEAAPIVSADFDDSSKIDGGDFLLWQREAGASQFLSDAFDADGNRDGNVDGDDRALWQSIFGNAAFVSSDAIPEPSSLCLALLATACLAQRCRRIHLLALHAGMWVTESFQ